MPRSPSPPLVDHLLATARRRLAAAPFAPSTREAVLLLRHVLGWSEARVLARGDAAVEPEDARRFHELLERRLSGEPMAYVLGEREFYGRTFRVDRRVLVPRPETEHLVELVLSTPLPPAPRLLDVGTGSGCLAVTLALELPRARVVATDLSPGALAVATANARRLGAEERVRTLACDLWHALHRTAFDLVVSNPPYVGRHEAGELSREIVDHEPALALFADAGGTAALEELVTGAAELTPGTRLALEIGRGQLAAVRRMAAASGLQLEAVRRDYARIPRVVLLRRPRPGEEVTRTG